MSFAQWSVKNSVSELLSCGCKNAEIRNVLILKSCSCGWIDPIKPAPRGTWPLCGWGFVHMLRMWGNSCFWHRNYLQICLIRTRLSGSTTASTWEYSQGLISSLFLFAHFWETFSVRTEIACGRRLQTFLDTLRTRINYLLLPYETGKMMPVGNRDPCSSFAYRFRICPTAVMANYSLCLAEMEDWCWVDHITTIFVKFLQPHSSMCSRKFIRTTISVLKGNDCFEPLNSCCFTVDFAAQKEVFLIGIFIFTPSLDTGSDSQVCTELWCQCSYPCGLHRHPQRAFCIQWLSNIVLISGF